MSDQNPETDRPQPKTIIGYQIIPDDQRMTMTLHPAPGRLLKADTVGGVIRNMGRLLKAVGDNVSDKARMEACVVGLKMTEEGGLDIEFALLPRVDPSDACDVTEREPA